MSRADVVQSHLEVLMQEYLEADELKVSPDDEVVVTAGTACYAVRLRSDRSEPHIEVYSIVLTEVEADPGLFEALNGINRRLGHSRIFWQQGSVVISGEIVGVSATADALGCLCGEIAQRADHEGPLLAAVFGGKVQEQRDEEDD